MADKQLTQAQEEYKWKVEGAANTLIEAQKIRKDKKLMKDVRIELKKRLNATKEAQASLG